VIVLDALVINFRNEDDTEDGFSEADVIPTIDMSWYE
jgi:hypothetical protein